MMLSFVSLQLGNNLFPLQIEILWQMFEANATMYPEKRIGDLPGW